MTNLVEVKEMNLVGKIYDQNEKFIWIETKEDMYCVAASKVTEVVQEAERVEAAFEAALEAAGIEFDGVVDGELQFTYIIKGFTYDIMASVDFEYNEFYMDTTHKGFDREEWANKKTFKKASTLVKNIIKWADK